MTAVQAPVREDWRMVAPWWHWPLRATASPDDRGRLTRPVFQKYDGPDAVNTFLRDPQLRLRFLDDADRVAVYSEPSPGKRFLTPKRTVLDRRKLYLPTHHRSYLVLSALHCETAGFPRVDPGDACEAGFVVRRRSWEIESGERREGARLVRRHTVARARWADAEAQLEAARRAGRPAAARLTTLEGRRAAAARVAKDAQAEVARWAERSGTRRVIKGWVPLGRDADGAVVPMPACPPADGSGPSPLAGVGAWVDVAETPEELEEAWFPLYPLVPDPRQPDHDGAGTSVYFGVVPAASADLTMDAKARFDDTQVYEIRCFVRRHRPVCPRSGPHCTCPITWSEPTEPYQLASQFDLQGTANRPVSVQMPDLAALHGDALRLGPGGTGGVRFVSPPKSALVFEATGVDASAPNFPDPDQQICTFAIPLITIVALFVFRIFLPIVVFVFQLWFLLALRFCIPPDFQLDFGLSAALEVVPPALEIDASIALDFEADFGVANLKNALNAQYADMKGPAGDLVGNKLDALATSGALDSVSRLQLVKGIASKVQQASEPPDRLFAPRVTRDEVVPA